MKEVINVLLIEDDPQDVEIISEMLSHPGINRFNLVSESRLEEGIRQARHGGIDIILTDLGLPDSSGMNSFIELDARVPNLPIIVLTGLSDENMGNEAVRMGAQDYLVKGEIQSESLKRSLAYGIERKKAKERIRESELKYKRLSSQLEETNALKELLLDVITHDLKNLAGIIYSCNQLMLEEDTDNDLLQTTHTSSRRLLDIIDNAYTLSKVTSGDQIDKPDIDLREILNEVIEEFTPTLHQTGMKVEFHGNGPLWVKANDIISEIFKNYTSNALKYAIKGSRLIIDTENINGHVVVKFRDFGETIPVEKRNVIFERKVQLENGKNKGFGLGLAIVKRIAEAHGGEVWVEPNDPKGNAFCLKLVQDR